MELTMHAVDRLSAAVAALALAGAANAAPAESTYTLYRNSVLDAK
jgi:hypothetical protein